MVANRLEIRDELTKLAEVVEDDLTSALRDALFADPASSRNFRNSLRIEYSCTPFFHEF